MEQVLNLVVSLYALGFIAYWIMDWLQLPRTRPAVAMLRLAYEPVLTRIREKVRPVPWQGQLYDLAPLIMVGALIVIKLLVDLFAGRG